MKPIKLTDLLSEKVKLVLNEDPTESWGAVDEKKKGRSKLAEDSPEQDAPFDISEKKMLPMGSSGGVTGAGEGDTEETPIKDPPTEKGDDRETPEKPQPKKDTADKKPAPQKDNGITLKPGAKKDGNPESAGGPRHHHVARELPIERKIRQIRLIKLLRKIRDAITPPADKSEGK
jgi:hypothetical protein